jgi:hypothetical protein
MTAIVKSADPARIPTNAWEIILKKVDWLELPTNTQYYISVNVDWSIIPINILDLLVHPVEWPDSPQKSDTLKRCAEALRSSIDKNWLATITSNLSKQPAVLQFTNSVPGGIETVQCVTNAYIIAYFQEFAKHLELDLKEYSGYLTNPHFRTEIGDGYQGEIQSPRTNEGTIYFGFVSDNGPIRMFRRLPKPGGDSTIVYADVHTNGVLWTFQVSTPQHTKDIAVSCRENGQLQQMTWAMNDTFSIMLDIDVSGIPHISGYFVTKPLTPRPSWVERYGGSVRANQTP